MEEWLSSPSGVEIESNGGGGRVVLPPVLKLRRIGVEEGPSPPLASKLKATEVEVGLSLLLESKSEMERVPLPCVEIRG